MSGLSQLLSAEGSRWEGQEEFVQGRFCQSRAHPAGSLREAEPRAERCHGGGGGLPLNTGPPAASGALREHGRADTTAGKCFWTEGMAFGKGGDSAGRTRGAVIRGRRCRGRFGPGLGELPAPGPEGASPLSRGSRRSPQRCLSLPKFVKQCGFN